MGTRGIVIVALTALIVLVFGAVLVILSRTGSGPATSGAPSPSRSATPTPSPSPAATPYLLGLELEPEDPQPGGQRAWIRNVSGSAVQFGCWTLTSASGGTMYVTAGLRVPAGGIALLTPDVSWLRQVDSVRFLDGGGRLVDETPQLIDNAHDDQIWYRTSGQWTFGRPPIWEGAINGRIVQRKPSGC